MLLPARSQAEIAAAKPAGAEGGDGAKLNWDTPKEDEDISKQPQHAKVCLHSCLLWNGTKAWLHLVQSCRVGFFRATFLSFLMLSLIWVKGSKQLCGPSFSP